MMQIEINHPLVKVRRQAENLRFILEAPKLKRGPDEVRPIRMLHCASLHGMLEQASPPCISVIVCAAAGCQDSSA